MPRCRPTGFVNWVLLSRGPAINEPSVLYSWSRDHQDWPVMAAFLLPPPHQFFLSPCYKGGSWPPPGIWAPQLRTTVPCRVPKSPHLEWHPACLKRGSAWLQSILLHPSDAAFFRAYSPVGPRVQSLQKAHLSSGCLFSLRPAHTIKGGKMATIVWDLPYKCIDIFMIIKQ